jgi:hypothetical protein
MKNIFLNIILLVNEYNLLIISAVVSFLILTFLIDGFKVSDNKYIRFLQIILLIIIGALFIIFIYEYFLGTPVECASNEEGNLSSHSHLKKDSEINLGLNGNVVITKEGGEVIAKSINNAANQIGIGATIGGVAAAVGGVLKTTALPPMQKVGLTLVGGAVGGLIHAGTTAANRTLASGVVTTQKVVNTERSSPSEEFSPASPFESEILDLQIFNGTDNSVETLLNSIYSLNIISLILIFILIFNLIIRLILNNNLELKWLNNLINQPNNNKFKSLIIKILKYIGKSNTINITLIIIILLISNIGSIYLLTILINNFEIFCKVYLDTGTMTIVCMLTILLGKYCRGHAECSRPRTQHYATTFSARKHSGLIFMHTVINAITINLPEQ